MENHSQLFFFFFFNQFNCVGIPPLLYFWSDFLQPFCKITLALQKIIK